MLFVKDSLDQLFLVRTKDFYPKESFAKMDMANKFLLEKGVISFCVCKWSDELVVIKNVNGRAAVLFLRVNAMMSDEEIEKMPRRELFKSHELPRGVEFANVLAKEGIFDSVLIIIYNDRVLFINQDKQRYAFKFEDEGEIISCWCLEERDDFPLLWITTHDNKLYKIDIMTGLAVAMQKAGSRTYLMMEFNGHLKKYSLEGNNEDGEVVSCILGFPSAMLIGSMQGKVYLVNSASRKQIANIDEPVVQVQWLWYPEGVLLVHGITNLHVYK